MKAKLYSSLLLIALGGYSAQSMAGTTTAPGVSCQPYYGSQSSYVQAGGYTGLYAKQAVSVMCPLTTGSSPYNVYININHPSSRSTTCYLGRANDYTGAISWTSGTVSGSGNYSKYFSTPSGGSYDTYAFYCDLAAGTTIRGVDWSQ